MGCTQSKIENEETVTRCKERKHFMKEAVSARNAFAAAHSAYTMSLKNTGAALSDYAHGEVQFPSAAAGAGGGSSSPLPGVTPPLSSAPIDMPPPPPLPPFPNPPFPPSPLQRAVTMPEISIPTPDPKRSDMIIEEENEDDMETESTHSLRHRNSKSSGGGGGIGGRGSASHRQGIEDEELPTPPSPPRTPPQKNQTPPPPPPPDNKGMASMSWDFFFPPMENVPGTTLAEVDESRIEREQLERKMMEERAKRAEMDSRSDEAERVKKNEMPKEAEVMETVEEAPSQPPPPPQAATKVVKRVKNVVQGETKKKGGQINLLQIFSELDDCFLKASESAHEVSKMLEANRLHYHSNFADNRGIFKIYLRNSQFNWWVLFMQD